jgi:zinc protease
MNRMLKTMVIGALAAVSLLAAGCATDEADQKKNADQGKALTGSDAAPQTDGDVTFATFNGMEIIVKRIPGAELATGQLYVRGGVRNWDKTNAGIEELALATAASGGTKKLDKDAFSRKVSALGSEISAGSLNDYSAITVKSLLPKWDESFGLLVDVFLQPALPASEVEIGRQRMLAGLRHEQESPDGRLSLLVEQTIYAGHPYANRSEGTAESVTAIKQEQLEPYLQNLRQTSRLLFVAVGDLDPNHVIEQVKTAFGSLPRGNYVETALPVPHFAEAKLTPEQRELPTNYVESVFSGPGWKDPDFAAGLVAMETLNHRVFEEVRTKRNLSYAPHATLSISSAVPLGLLYVTAVDPNTTMKVMFDEVHRIQSEPISDKELAGTKGQFISGLFMRAETTDGQASMLARAQIYAGSWKRVRELPEMIKAVTPAQAQEFAKKRIGQLQTEVLAADPTKLDATLFKSL